MSIRLISAAACAVLLLAGVRTASSAETARSGLVEGGEDASYWIEPMKKVHTRFTGTNGTFAHFGDSITVTMAFWAPLAGEPKNMSAEMARAHRMTKAYQKTECWSRWKGREFGSNGSMTIRWAHEHVGRWLEKLNPEVALVMFGSNDVGQMDTNEYAAKTREVVARCLDNGTVVILSTMPPRSGFVKQSEDFAHAARTLAKELKVPLVDYYAEIVKRRPNDWNGALPQFSSSPGDEYQVPTLIARDGVHPSNPKAFANDYSEDALRTSGYGLRNFLVLMAYTEVIEKVLKDFAGK